MGFLGQKNSSPTKLTPTNKPVICKHCGKNALEDIPEQTVENVKGMLEELADVEGTTPWEDGFIADQQKSLEKYGRLTPKQLATVNKIYDERVIKRNVR